MVYKSFNDFKVFNGKEQNMNKKERVQIVESGNSWLLNKEQLIKAVKEVKRPYVSEVLEAYAAIEGKPKLTIRNGFSVMESLSKFRYSSIEKFFVLTLDNTHSIIRTLEINRGLINKTMVSIPEVFRAAIIDHAAAIIVAHNHPSGVLDPSNDDLNLTRKIEEGGKLLDIPVLDHVIIEKTGYYSFFEKNLMGAK